MGIFTSYRQRHYVWASVIAFIVPELGFFYLGLGRLGLIYGAANFFLNFVWGLFALRKALHGVPLFCLIAAMIAIRIAAALHVSKLAKLVRARANYPWFARLHYWIVVFYIVPFLIVSGIRGLFFEPFVASSTSMFPTLAEYDYLFANKFVYGHGPYSFPINIGFTTQTGGHSPERGDVAVFRLLSDTNVVFIKRVIGLPGDKVQLYQGRLYINGNLVPRNAVKNLIFSNGEKAIEYIETLPNNVSYSIVEVGDNKVGDNTREFVVPQNKYFVLGDNRDNSLDSRFDIGFVPVDNIYAKAVVAFDQYWIPRFVK